MKYSWRGGQTEFGNTDNQLSDFGDNGDSCVRNNACSLECVRMSESCTRFSASPGKQFDSSRLEYCIQRQETSKTRCV